MLDRIGMVAESLLNLLVHQGFHVLTAIEGYFLLQVEADLLAHVC